MVFALAGPKAVEEPPTCENSCPVISSLEASLGGDSVPVEQKVSHHLNDHIREALLESGLLDVMGRFKADGASTLSTEAETALREANARLQNWSCLIKLDDVEKQMLSGALSRLPKSAWISMPRTLWRLRKKLRSR
jgi:hypothetical protein